MQLYGSRAFSEARPIILERAAFKCEECGVPLANGSGQHAVHHKDGNGFNNNLDNLIALCATCHGAKLNKGYKGRHIGFGFKPKTAQRFIDYIDRRKKQSQRYISRDEAMNELLDLLS